MFVLGLSKTAATGVKEEHRDLWEESKDLTDKLRTVQARELQKLRSLGIKNLIGTGSANSGLAVPGGVSDIDFNFPSQNPDQDSRRLTELGIPLHKHRGQSRTHRYYTSEGVKVDLNIRHPDEFAFLKKTKNVLRDLPEHVKAEHVFEKKRLSDSGDKKAYKRFKYNFYIKHGVIPKDWKSVRKA